MAEALPLINTISLRLLQSSDLDLFLELGTATCGSLHGRPNLAFSDLRKRFEAFVKEFGFRPESEIWVASRQDDHYLGHLWLYKTTNRFNGNKELWVWDLTTRAEHRNQGVGGVMMQHARRRAKELGCVELWLMVAEDNDIAKRLYASCGLETKGQMMAAIL